MSGIVVGCVDMAAIDTLELELRKLAAVAAVGFTGSPDKLTVHLAVHPTDDLAAVRAEAHRLASRCLDRALAVVVVSLEPPPAEDAPIVSPPPVAPLLTPPAPTPPLPSTGVGRVELLGVHSAPESTPGGDDVEVHLAHHGAKTIGHGRAGQMATVAQATLDALVGLGWTVPFSVRTAVRLVFGFEGAVVVSLVGPGGERMGIGQGTSSEEAAAKATLHAVNRYIERQRLTVVAGPGGGD